MKAGTDLDFIDDDADDDVGKPATQQQQEEASAAADGADDVGDLPPVYDPDTERASRSHLIEPRRAYLFALLLNLAPIGSGIAALLLMDDELFFVPLIVLGVTYIVYLKEAFGSPVLSYTSYLKYTTGTYATMSELESLYATAPVLRLSVQCYHYETRVRTVTHTDSQGRTSSRLETYTVRVDTHSASTFFPITSFRSEHDGTQITDALPFDLVRVRLHETVLFGDTASRVAFQRFSRAFRNENRFDVHQDYHEHFGTPGLHKRMLMANETFKRPFWMNRVVCVLAILLLFAWPYRLALQSRAVKVRLQMTKVVYAFSR